MPYSLLKQPCPDCPTGNLALPKDLEPVVLKSTIKGNKNWINARFKLAFTAKLARKETVVGIEKLLEGTGVRLAERSLSAFRFLGPATAIANAGYDADDVPASEDAYKRLPLSCKKYEDGGGHPKPKTPPAQ